jgi:hypothetical protein
MDLMSMIKAWPEIAKYINENYNFFNKLETIFFEDLDQELLKRAYESDKKGNSQYLQSLVVFTKQDLFSFFSQNKKNILIGVGTVVIAGSISWVANMS